MHNGSHGNLLLVTIMICVRAIYSERRFVNYTVISQATSAVPGRVACAETYADNEYFAAKINDVTGACEGLKWSYGSSQQNEPGYSYLKKIKTIEIYQPWLDISSSSFQWLIPGIFGVGGSLEFYMTTPSGGSWDGFAIELLDTSDFNSDVYSGESETIMLHIMVVRANNRLLFKTWVFGWTNILGMSMPFSEGSITKFTIVPHSDVLQILMDDVHLCQYEHTVDPTTAKLFQVGAFSNTAFKIHNITFIGV